MFLGGAHRSTPARCMLILMIFLTVLTSTRAAWAGLPGGGTPAATAGPVTWKICEPPPVCFISKEAKDQWAKDNHCRFLEDVCDKSTPDNKGAKPEDQGFWGDMWDGVKSGLTYGYQFVKGLFEGLKGQVTDLINMISNVGDVVSGLIDLGKSFYSDPKGTIVQLGELLGQEAVDTLTKATQCGAYDLGKVIGGYVSPAIVLKLSSRLTKYAGKLADAVKTIKHDLGCASFAAGTPVLTPDGPLPIERIAVGQLVASRNENSFADAPRAVEQLFGRVAPSYRLLQTDRGTLTLTDEHPLWVQGKGWTEAQEIAVDDVIAGSQGDALVQSNQAVAKPLRVYNFTVASTHNYFVGGEGIWAHNAKCVLPMPYKAAKSPSKYLIGASDGGPGAWTSISRPDTPAYRFEKQVTGAPANVEYRVNGVNFDGFDAKTGALLDAKNYTIDNPLVKGEPDFLVDKLKKDAVIQAKDQLAAAGGKPIEWHVSNQKAADTLRDLFAQSPDTAKIKVIFTPDIVN